MTTTVFAGPAGPARRVVLTVPLAVALATGACTGGRASHELTPAQTRAVDAARARALAAEQGLIARYDAALLLPGVRADQALVDRLTAVRGEHTAHLAALREGTAGEGVPSTASSAGALDTPSAGAPATDAKTAVAGLVRAEQDAADRLTADVMATEGHTAQLLASIAASEAGHAALLLGAA